MVYPGAARRPIPQKVEMVVFDFDGVMTDNRVWVDQDGRELVAAYRSDSLGLNEIRRLGVRSMVLSTETNPVVAARCQKLELEYIQGVENKAAVLREFLSQQHIDALNVIYVGNDINDVSCFPLVGCAVVVSDAHVEARRKADVVLSQAGGYGAVRELCDLIVNKLATV
jgi:YrbI family 3-deoxy-D-manno-octulosonate 8-phosphate phosphatase